MPNRKERPKKLIQWIGAFLEDELMYGRPNSYYNALDVYEYAKEETIKTGKVHEVKFFEDNAY